MKKTIYILGIALILIISGCASNQPEKIKDGEHTVYYDNKQVASISTYKNGKKNGFHKSWHKNGALKSNGGFKNGKAHGLYLLYYKNGKLADKTIYKNSKADGESIAYYKNGNRSLVANYSYGKPHGASKYYDESGALTKTYYFSNGRMVKTDPTKKSNKPLVVESTCMQNTTQVTSSQYADKYKSSKMGGELAAKGKTFKNKRKAKNYCTGKANYSFLTCQHSDTYIIHCLKGLGY